MMRKRTFALSAAMSFLLSTAFAQNKAHNEVSGLPLTGRVTDSVRRPIKHTVITVSDGVRSRPGTEVACDSLGRFTTSLPETSTRVCLAPTLDIDHLNGVNTWDLVLISRHILGLEPLNTPYKLISADANRSGTVSTFDIVQLRKTILGTFPSFNPMASPPGQRSWNFIQKNHVFSNPANPFAEFNNLGLSTLDPLESITVSTLPANTDFVGCKIGDVDLSASPHARPAPNTAPLSMHLLSKPAKGSDRVVVPVAYTGSADISAYQFALRLDSRSLEFQSVEKGDLGSFDLHNFGLDNVADGLIKTCWFPNPMREERDARQGDVLFYLCFKAKSNENGVPAPVLEETSDFNQAWDGTGNNFALVNENQVEQRHEDTETMIEPTATVTLSPNPTSGEIQVQFGTSTAKEGAFTLFDQSGRNIAFHRIPLGGKGAAITVHDLEGLPAGIYLWNYVAGQQRACGTVVKQ